MSSLTKAEPLVSIIINNYNYERFLKEAIDSALNQTYKNIEVIVIDDGSTDNSREIIKGYGDQIKAVLKPNGGQASCFNLGFKESQGDIICFLDSDDAFVENKVEECVKFLQQKTANNPLVMVYHLLEIVDTESNSLNQCEPAALRNYEPNLYKYACKYRFFPYPASQTTGNAFTRELLAQIFPMPEKGVKISADNIVVRAAGLLGEVYGMDLVLGKYRVHHSNHWYGKEMEPELYRKFTIIRDDFLNDKLKEYGKRPVISFFDSMYAKYFFQKNGDYEDVIKLALRVIKWHVNLETIKFFLKAALQYCLWLINPQLVKLKEPKSDFITN
ncbi:MAG: glycosyltransferase [Symploca sp. SIO1B1]|nr:glycosyltransferase [Symploca sp. SIO1B1]